MIYLNARSLVSKLNDLELLVSEQSPDLVLICETWLNSEISNGMLDIPGYFIEPELRKDRLDTTNGIGGGLLVYVRAGLIIKPIENDSVYNQFCQFLLSSDNHSTPLNVTLIYRSPNSNEYNTNKLCELLNHEKHNSLIIGDFNFPGIRWQENTSDKKGETFFDTVINSELNQLIDFPTHIKGNILDLVLTDVPDKILSIESLGNLGNSDHSILSIELLFNPKLVDSSEQIYNWRKADYEGLNNYLSNFDWFNNISSSCVNSAWSTFKETVMDGVDQFVPKITRRSNNHPPWLTNNVRRLINQKQRHYKSYMKFKSIELLERYKISEKLCKKAVRSAKRRYEKKLAHDPNQKKFFAFVKKKTSTRVNVGPLKSGNLLLTESTDMAKVLNDFFCSVFSNEDTTKMPSISAYCELKVNDINFSSSVVKEKICKLRPYSTPGADKITSKLLIDHSDILAEPLAHIFNLSMSSGIVPQDWREANVTPIFKKGSKSKAENYRPVSLTSIPCKVMESIIKDKVVSHLIDNQLIHNSQHGFLSNKSCTTNLLEFLEVISSSLDDGVPMDLIYLDFSKAFDKVPKNRLLLKMKSVGIDGRILNWIGSWLSNRRQRVVINGCHSEWKDVLSGVPQGSVLGPLAFLIYINDLDSCTKLVSVMRKFADDTKAGHKVINDCDRETLQQCINDLLEWADTWCMQFNASKCKILHVGRKNPKFSYFMNDVKLEVSSHEKDLGVIITDNLKPSMQCVEAAKKARFVLNQITRSFHFRDRKTFLKLYKQYVRCHLETSIPVWNPYTAKDIELLEAVQRRAVQQISGLEGDTYLAKCSELGIMTLQTRRLRTDLIQTYKILKGLDQVDSKQWFQTVENAGSRFTRNTAYPLNLIPRQVQTEQRRNFFSVRVVGPWNMLPHSIKDAATLASFKSRLDNYLISTTLSRENI